MAPSKADKAAEELKANIAEKGLYAATESDQNSIAVSEEYIGVSPEYQNHANDTDAPLKSEDDDIAALEDLALEHEETMAELATQVSPRTGHSTDTVHPSEKKKPQDVYIEGNRTLMESAVASAQGGDTTTDEVAESPFDSPPPPAS